MPEWLLPALKVFFEYGVLGAITVIALCFAWFKDKQTTKANRAQIAMSEAHRKESIGIQTEHTKELVELTRQWASSLADMNRMLEDFVAGQE